mgnify:CR=1 FL=1
MTKNNGTALTREGILGVTDRELVKVIVPEWHGAVWIRTMTGAERYDFEIPGPGGQLNLKQIRERLLVKALCDEKGKRLFTDDDVDSLSERNATVIDRLFDTARTINKIGDDAVDAEEKKSEGDR